MFVAMRIFSLAVPTEVHPLDKIRGGLGGNSKSIDLAVPLVERARGSRRWDMSTCIWGVFVIQKSSMFDIGGVFVIQKSSMFELLCVCHAISTSLRVGATRWND